MNLENLGLVELNAQEQKEIDGGWVLAVIAICVAIYIATTTYTHNKYH